MQTTPLDVRKLPFAALMLAMYFALSPCVAAQRQFEELGLRHLPFETNATTAVVLGDVDGDGDDDLIAAARSGQNQLYLNNGEGAFSDESHGRLPTGGQETRALALGDVDRDGDLDLVVGKDVAGAGAQNRLLLNDGTGRFIDVTATHMPVAIDPTVAVVLADVDGDGALDLVVGNRSAFASPNRVYVNDGTGVFRDDAGRLPGDLDNTEGVAVADVDADGDIDIVVGNGFAQNRLYLNDGAGFFVDATASRLPSGGLGTVAVAAGDVDGDGDVDLVLGNQSFSGARNRLYVNDGTGVFRDVTAGRLPADQDGTTSAALVDLDGDGDLDLVFGNGGSVAPFRAQNRVHLNNGSGSFAPSAVGSLPVARISTLGLAVGDVDRDGDADVVFGNDRAQNFLYLNNGTATFVDTTVPRLPPDGESSWSIALGDVDGDGDLDLAAGNAIGFLYNPRNQLYLNDGRGNFRDVSAEAMPSLGNDTAALAFGDVDGDGDADLICGNGGQATNQPNSLYRNDGTGSFVVAAGHLPSLPQQTRDVALGDVDGDGDLDLVCANGGFATQLNRLYLNDGSGRFTDETAQRMPADLELTSAVLLGDVDGDGDLDLAFGNGQFGGTQNRLYLNDGTGTFTDVTAARMPQILDFTFAGAIGDVDNDGDLDLVFGNFAEQHRLYLNDGTGRFTDVTAAHLPEANRPIRRLALGDIDGDGDQDLVLAGPSRTGAAPENRLYLNNGLGMFDDVTATRMPDDNHDSFDVALGDVDGDGDLDLAFGNNTSDNKLYMNLQRQLDTPQLVAPGRSYRLDIYSRYVPGNPERLAVPFLSTGTASIAIPPLGTFGLDPSAVAALPAVLIPRREGMASVLLRVPSSPRAVGATVYAQALVAPVIGSGHLTNVTGDSITR